jgi:hypothetical protein
VTTLSKVVLLVVSIVVVPCVQAGGYRNTAYGTSALVRNTTGYDNSAFGAHALNTNTKGIENTACGYEALYRNRTGSYNTASGSGALRSNKIGKWNTAIGYHAGYSNIKGRSNIFIGMNAGASEKGSNKLYIDVIDTKKPLIYGDFVSNTLKVNGKLYATKFITSSDERLKGNIQPLRSSLATVLQLQGKSYRLLDQPSGTNDIGLIAQDVEKVLPEIVSETEDGYKAIVYQSLTAVLIEAMKEQQIQITALQMENQQLKAVMAEQMDALLARVTMLESVQVAEN